LIVIATVAATLIGFVIGALAGAWIVGKLTPATDWPDPVAVVIVPLVSGALSAYLIWRIAWRLVGKSAVRP
jgi:sugar phosphate permease